MELRSGGPGKLRISAASALLAASATLLTGGVGTADWFPVRVETREPPFSAEGTLTRVDYFPGDGARRKWRLCATLPGLQFPYFAAVAHGLSAETARQGVEIRIDDAGGFHAESQRVTLEDCLANGYSAILVAPAQDGALAGLRQRALSSGVVVIDMVTGSGASAATAHVAAEPEQVGRAVGNDLVERHPLGDQTLEVAWFPGPQDAAFAVGYDEGFRDAIRDSAINVERGGFSPLDPVQLREALTEALDDAAALGAVAGVGPVILEAASALGPLARGITIISTGVSPEIVAAIKAGDIASAVNDKPVVQGRIAVDIAIRALEGRPFVADLRPTLEIVDRTNVNSFDSSTALVPGD